MTHVKVCGITNLEDGLAAVEAGADVLGFNFYARSPRYVTPEAARRVIDALPAGVTCVGVFVNESREEVGRVARAARLDAVQLHGDETPEFCEALRGVETIKALRVGPAFTVESARRFRTDALLLDAYVADEYGGTGHTFDWRLAALTREAVPRLYLAGGLKPDNVAAAVSAVRPHAVDVCSGVETSPGRKSLDLMRRFVEQVRGAGGE